MTIGGFDVFFHRATGFHPHHYQQQMGDADRLPDVIDVPTGHGKTPAIVLAWLWHRTRQGGSPAARRLLIALPMRTLVDQTSRSIARWLANLGLTADVDLVVLMGGTPRSVANDWRANPDRPCVVVGTVDLIVSKTLVRGYATARHAYPMDAALSWNDAHLVIDETQLATASTRTLRQVRGFQRLADPQPFGTIGLTCMSATIDRALLDTVDNPVAGATVVQLTDADDDDDIRRRRAATRVVRATGLAVDKPKDVAAHLVAHHRPGTLTLLIVNTVATARDVHAALLKAGPSADVVLLHSRFRPADRAPLVDRATGNLPPEGRIVVTTQVIEAGVDVDAALLVTEVPSWPSFVQRVGRCNRAGLRDDAEIHWLPAGRSTPYDTADIARTTAALQDLQSQSVTSASLLALDVRTNDRMPPTIRHTDFLSLFDTASDLTGNDLDISPYIRESEGLDAFVCWAQWPGAQPPADLRMPPHEARCAVGIKDLRDYQHKGAVLWRRDPHLGRWQAGGAVRPGETLLVDASTGGYDPTTGFDGRAPGPVPPLVGEEPVPLGDPGSETTNAADDLALGCADWIPLDQHLRETAEEARMLVEATDLAVELADDVVLAARLHDVGKAHPVWQDALCRTAAPEESDSVASGRPWAKSSNYRRLRHLDTDGREVVFRHELAGVLALETSFVNLLAGAHDRELVLYLVLAHHGMLRVTVRELGERGADALLGIRDGESPELPDVLGTAPAHDLETSTRQFGLDGDPDRDLRAWADIAQDLLERYGPFRLAYLETLVRAADWRASARHDGGGRT